MTDPDFVTSERIPYVGYHADNWVFAIRLHRDSCLLGINWTGRSFFVFVGPISFGVLWRGGTD